MEINNPWDNASSHGDNFQLDVRSASLENFEQAMRIAFSNHSSATHYRTSDAGLVFYWREPESDIPDAHPLPNEMNVEGAISLAWQWLRSFNEETIQTYTGKQPAIDGHVELGGFRVYNERWGFVAGSHAAIVAIQPQYILIHK